MLALADGKSWNQIETELHTSRPTIARWQRRFEEQELAGLDPRHKGSEPRAATAAVQARVLRKATQPPDDGTTHWTCRRLDRYMASNDANFEQKAADIIALYMKPPQHAALF